MRMSAPQPTRAENDAAPIGGQTSANAANIDRSRRVLRQFRIVVNTVRAHFQRVEHLAGVTGAQAWALHIVSEQPGLGVSELARAMDVRQPTASAYAKTLRQLELLDIRREAADRRMVQLFLTPKGHGVLGRAPGPFAGVLPKALESLGEAQLARLEGDLGALIRLMGVDALSASGPLGEI